MLPYVVKETSRLSRLMLQRPCAQQPRPLSLSSRNLFGGSATKTSSSNGSHQRMLRFYSPTAKQMEEASEEGEEAAPEIPLFTKKDKQEAAQDYNLRRAAYNKQVSLVRKQYFEEIAKERAAEEARLEAEQQAITRRRLERQRLKNIRSAQNALKEEERRQNRAREFDEYLRIKQEERDERKRRYSKARGMVLAELEAEADLWLTTPEEVEEAFSHEAEQKLWARPNGVLGSPTPSVDSHFWQYESHTMHMDKTFRTTRDFLLEEILESVYEESMVDEDFWTPELLKDREALENKAKLRAMVRAEGRRALLEKQKQMLEDYFGTEEDEVPKKMPAPNVNILGNVKAQEKEGVKILLKDPTRFFRFENEDGSNSQVEGEEYSGPSLGAPVGLRDELRDGTPWSGVFPVGIAKVPKADVSTQREKKRMEREQKMWEAAEAEKLSEDAEVEKAASDDMAGSAEDEIDYDNNDWDSDDEEWEKGLDPVEDAELLQAPREKRYSEEDIRWVISQLEVSSEYLHSQMNREIDSTRQRILTQREIETESEEEAQMQELLNSLTNEQMIALVEVDSQNLQEMSPDELSDALSKVPGLEQEQVKRILDLDDSLSGNSEEPNDKDS